MDKLTKFLKIYGVIIAVIMMAVAILFLILGGVCTISTDAESWEDAVGVTFSIILGIIFLFLGLIFFIYSILFIISLARIFKNKGCMPVDIIMLVVDAVLFIASIITAIVQKEAGIVAVTICVLLIEGYAIPAFIRDKKLRKLAKERIVESVENNEVLEEKNIEETKEEDK